MDVLVDTHVSQVDIGSLTMEDKFDAGENSSDAENRWEHDSRPYAADTAGRPQRVDCMIFPPLHEIFSDADEQETRECFPDLSEEEFRQLLAEMEAARALQDNPPQNYSYPPDAVVGALRRIPWHA
mmetsp:Transcript_4733/g.9770  ORF Transcript_4733/g.9770 Transcript_4733/m.9770 type:complete len:126 (+) Transcript_4733:3-380(+)